MVVDGMCLGCGVLGRGVDEQRSEVFKKLLDELKMVSKETPSGCQSILRSTVIHDRSRRLDRTLRCNPGMTLSIVVMSPIARWIRESIDTLVVGPIKIYPEWQDRGLSGSHNIWCVDLTSHIQYHRSMRVQPYETLG